MPPKPPSVLSAELKRKRMVAAASLMVERSQFARRAGLTFGAGGLYLRDMYEALGYERYLTILDYRDRYERGGVAERIVEAHPRATWTGGADIRENEDPENLTDFEKAIEGLWKRLDVWSRFLRTDVLNSLGRYSALLIGTARKSDGETLALEMPKLKGPEDVIYLTPLAEDRAIIAEFDTDVLSPRHGLPKYYQCLLAQESSHKVHWSRVIHVAEGLLEDDVYGKPRLRAVWNYLDDLEKIVGGGAEAAWKRIEPGMQVDIDPEIDITPEQAKKLEDQLQDFRHGFTRYLRTQGAEIKNLSASAQTFGANADTMLSLISATTGIPQRILDGSERGELASTQDRSNWGDRIMERRREFAEPLIRAFITRLQEYGALPKPSDDDYEVVWPEIDDLDEGQKAAVAAQWAAANVAQYSVEKKIITTAAEIREKVYGLEPLDDSEQPPEPEPPPGLTPPEGAPGEEAPGQTEPTPPGAPEPEVKAAAQGGDEAILRVLEEAILHGHDQVINFLLGLEPREPEVIELEVLGGPGSGNFGHSGRPGERGGSGGGEGGGKPEEHVKAPEVEVRAAIDRLFREVTRDDAGYQQDPIEETKDGYRFSVRSWGNWVSTPERRGEEDDDHRVPDQKTIDKLDSIIDRVQEKNPNLTVRFRVQEKDWLDVYVANRPPKPWESKEARYMGGPGSGNFGHAGIPGQRGGSAAGESAVASNVRTTEMRTRVSGALDRLLASRPRNEFGLKGAATTEVSFRSEEHALLAFESAGKELQARGYAMHPGDEDNTVQTFRHPNGEAVRIGTGPRAYGRHALTLGVANTRDEWVLHDLGGPGSGNFGHAGRPGERGGSSSGGGGLDPKVSEAMDNALAPGRRDGGPRDVGHGVTQTRSGETTTYEGPGGKTRVEGDLGQWGRSWTAALIQADRTSHLGRFTEEEQAHQTAARRASDWNPDKPLPVFTGLGGPGSGNFGHAGRPGERGGSGPGGDEAAKGEGGKAAPHSPPKGGPRGNAKLPAEVQEVLARPASHYAAEIQDQGTDILNGGSVDTMRQYTDPTTGKFTPERAALHSAIVAKYLDGVTPPTDGPRVVTMLGGGAASGKSSMEAQLGLDPNRVVINPDSVKADLPEWEREFAPARASGIKPNGALAAYVHEESSHVSKLIATEAAKRGYHMTIDGVGDSGVEKLGANVAKYADNGPGNPPAEVHANYISVDADDAYSRALARADDKTSDSWGRMVLKEHHYAGHRDVSRTFPLAVQRGVFTRFSVYDGNVPKGTPSRVVASGQGSHLQIHDQAGWERFLAKGF